MEVVERATRAAENFQPFDQNIGKAALFTAGLGVIDGLSGLLEKIKIPRAATGPAISLAVSKIPQVHDFLGDDLADVLNTCGYVAPVDEYLRLRERVANLVGKPVEMIPGGSSSHSSGEHSSPEEHSSPGSPETPELETGQGEEQTATTRSFAIR